MDYIVTSSIPLHQIEHNHKMKIRIHRDKLMNAAVYMTYEVCSQEGEFEFLFISVHRHCIGIILYDGLYRLPHL